MKHFTNDNYAALIIGVAGGLLLQPILSSILPRGSVTLHIAFFLIAALGAPTGFAILTIVLPRFKRFYKFVLVGCLNTAVDLGILNIAILVFGVEKVYLFPLYATIGFIAATLNSYFWNQHWTFDDTNARGLRSVAWFYVVSIAGFLINVGISTGLVFAGLPPGFTLVLWENAAKALGIVVSLATNYAGYKYLVFHKGKRVS